MSGPCPTLERLASALRGWQRSEDDSELAVHLTDCATCRAQLERMAGGSGWLEAKARTAAASPAPALLQQAMSALESGCDLAERATSAGIALDFLQAPAQSGDLRRFGPYEVLELIARGGMGIVLKARDPTLDRIVALKILPPGLAANSLARARFVREARSAAAVVHEHVVPIYAVDEFAGLPYLVMQFIQGRSLAERIRICGPLRLEEILRIGAQTAAGLAAAHAQGLVHRDIKPSNILLENSVERVKLTDFGLARAADDAGLTRTGELAGTPEFMSPEQAGNEAVDHRSDLFSFGSVLYVMCTGHSPFQASSVIAALRQVCDARPPPGHEVNSSIPRWLSDIVARLMAKAPAERFQSAREVGELLERYLARVQQGELGELPGAFKRPLTARRVRQWVAVGAAAGLALGALLLFLPKDRPTANSNSSLPISSAEEFTAHDESGVCLGGFENLQDALERMPAGGIVELRWNGAREMPPIKLPAKRLTLRAALDFHPVWKASASAPALLASAALSLENIRFVMTSDRGEQPPPGRGHGRPHVARVPPSGLALISVAHGPLRVSHCTLDARSVDGRERACLILTNVSACRVEHTMLFVPPAKAVVWQEASGAELDAGTNTARLTMTNCIAVAGDVFWLDLNGSSRARIEIDRCTFYGPETFCVSPSLVAADLEVIAHHNVFDTDFVIFDARQSASPPLPQWWRWRERDNLYSPEPQHGQRYITGVAIHDGPARLADWNLWWNQGDLNSRQVQIKYANSRIDRNDGAPGRLRRASPEPRGFRIAELRRVDGPPLELDQWAQFGADTANVGPVSSTLR